MKTVWIFAFLFSFLCFTGKAQVNPNGATYTLKEGVKLRKDHREGVDYTDPELTNEADRHSGAKKKKTDQKDIDQTMESVMPDNKKIKK
jgi:hypothetical protein